MLHCAYSLPSLLHTVSYPSGDLRLNLNSSENNAQLSPLSSFLRIVSKLVNDVWSVLGQFWQKAINPLFCNLFLTFLVLKFTPRTLQSSLLTSTDVANPFRKLIETLNLSTRALTCRLATTRSCPFAVAPSQLKSSISSIIAWAWKSYDFLYLKHTYTIIS